MTVWGTSRWLNALLLYDFHKTDYCYGIWLSAASAARTGYCQSIHHLAEGPSWSMAIVFSYNQRLHKDPHAGTALDWRTAHPTCCTNFSLRWKKLKYCGNSDDWLLITDCKSSADVIHTNRYDLSSERWCIRRRERRSSCSSWRTRWRRSSSDGKTSEIFIPYRL